MFYNIKNSYYNPNVIPDRGVGAALAKAFKGKSGTQPAAEEPVQRRVSVREQMWAGSFEQANNRLRKKKMIEDQIKEKLQKALLEKFRSKFTKPKPQKTEENKE